MALLQAKQSPTKDPKKLILITTGIFTFLLGVIIAWLTVKPIRELIRDFYQWTSGSAFEFYGKHLIINVDPFYYLIFGIVFLALWICLKQINLKTTIFWVAGSISIFLLTMAVYTFIDGYIRIISCTMCDSGIVKLHWNHLNYNLVTEVSLLTALGPLIIKTFRKASLRVSEG